jgi:uncharacterized protein (DUF433 family)
VSTSHLGLYLQRIEFAADGYAQLIRLPQYQLSEVTIHPDHEFGRPRFAHGGAAVDDVIDLFRAGEPVDTVAEEFGLSRDEVEDANTPGRQGCGCSRMLRQCWPEGFPVTMRPWGRVGA